MKLLVFIAILLPTLILTQPSEPTRYIDQDFDVIKYSAKIRFDSPKNKYINGSNTVSLIWKNNNSDSKFYFNLRGPSVDSIIANAIHINFEKVGIIIDTLYYYSIKKEDLPNDKEKFTIYYSGIMDSERGSFNWGGVHYEDNNLYAMGVGFANNYVSTTQHWLPCYDHPSDKALFEIDITAPKELVAISNGLLNNVIEDEIFATYSWKTDNPVATYLLTFAVGEFIELDYSVDELPLLVYSKRRDSVVTEFAYRNFPEMINFLEKKFGAYPFEKAAFYNATKGAMEHQTLITMSTSIAYQAHSNNDNTNPVALHELSHQWFGNLVTPYDFRDAWLNEGLATFCESLWLEELYNKESYYQDLNQKRTLYLGNIINREGKISLYDFKRTENSSNYPTTIYYKGALVMAMINEIIRLEGNNLNITDILKKYLERFYNSNVSTVDLINIFEEQIDLPDNFWENWVYGNEFPLLRIDFNHSNNELIIENLNEKFDLDYLKLSIRFKTIDEVIEKDFILLSNFEKIDNVLDNVEVKELISAEIFSDKNPFLYEIHSFNNSLSSVENYSESIIINPNPTAQNITIEFEGELPYSIELMTTYGQKLILERSPKLINNFNFNDFKLANGLYFLIFNFGNNYTMKKIILEKN